MEKLYSPFPEKRHKDGPEYQYADEGAKTEEDRILHKVVAPELDHSIRMAEGGVVSPYPNYMADGGIADSPSDPLTSVGQIQTPGIPAGTDLSGLNQYIDKQKKAVSAYGPEQEKAVMDHFNQARYGTTGSLANAGAGFADALMQGVARAGNPGFQEKLQQSGQNAEQMALDNMHKMREENIQNVKENMALDQMSPDSAVNKQAVAAMAPLAKRMGLPAAGVTAPQLSGMFEPATNFAKADTAKWQAVQEMAIKKLELALSNQKFNAEEKHKAVEDYTRTMQTINEAKKLEEEHKKNAADIANKEAERLEGAAKGLNERPYYQKVFEAVTPRALNSKSTNEYEDILSGKSGNAPAPQVRKTKSGISYTIGG